MINKPGMCVNCDKIEWYLVDNLCKECWRAKDEHSKTNPHN